MKRDDYRKSQEEDFPEELIVGGVSFGKERGLRYGWNPGQPAAFYREIGAHGPTLGNMRILQENPNKRLGYINMEDASAALSIVHQLHQLYGNKEKIVAVMKHVIPSGVGKGSSVTQAFERAWKCNSLSAFGGVVGVSDVVDESLARLLGSKEYFVEAIVAPGYSDSARELLAQKKDLRVLEVGALEEIVESPVEYKRVRGGLLVQERYQTKVRGPNDLKVVSARQPTQEELDTAVFLWNVCGFVRSNAIVIGDSVQTIGIGSGQQSRIDSFDLAVRYAQTRSGLGCRGKVAASDAFFPKADCVELAAREGISAIVYTLGSIEDKSSIAVANEHGIALLDASERCFTHG
ncbi:hypothetical protein C4580_01320 [Candidatus Woesearchaeota archaeon]|nr:MAG: hypothetical protein C4580_01320 [Candidatus Woesearchaeota archaeon]